MKQTYYSGRLLSKWFSLKNRWVSTYRKLQNNTKVETLQKLNKLSLTLGIKRKIAVGSLAMITTIGAQAQLSFEKATFGPNKTLNGLGFTDASPTFTDLNNDGTLDMVVGDKSGKLHFYSNAISNGQNEYTELVGIDNPLDGIRVSSDAKPAFVDLDGDGDLDLAVGDGNGFGAIKYYTNDNGALVEQTGTNNPFDGMSVYRGASPTFADMDGDGDQDLVFANYSFSVGGVVEYYSNKTTNGVVVLTEETGGNNPFDGIIPPRTSRANLVDLDGDNDFDLVIAHRNGPIDYYLNDISGGHGIQKQTTGNPFSTISGGYDAHTAFVDFDGDNDVDLIIGDKFGDLSYYENKNGAFTKDNSVNDIFNHHLRAGQGQSTPFFVDFDGDGDLDLVSGEYYGEIKFFQNNTGTFVEQTGANNPFDGITANYNSSPEVLDFDGDGDLDLVTGTNDGTIYFYKNTSGTFAEQTGANNPFDGIDVGSYSTVTLVDFDGDGDLDLLAGSYNNGISYFTNDGNDEFTEQTGVDNPFDGHSLGGRTDVSVGDLNGDSYLDVIVGTDGGSILYFTNDGTNEFTQETGAENPLESLAPNVGLHNSTPVLVDLNGDGKLDVVFGEHGGYFEEYSNTTPEIITSVSVAEKEKVVIYPNPVSTQLFVDKEGVYQISDATGIVLQEGQVSANGIDVSKLNEGYYIINVEGTITSFVKR